MLEQISVAAHLLRHLPNLIRVLLSQLLMVLRHLTLNFGENTLISFLAESKMSRSHMCKYEATISSRLA